MNQTATLDVMIDHTIGVRDFKIFGHFIEHFHRQIYGGLFDPGNPLSDDRGFRTDVMEAMRRIHVPVIRWPGGCFVSAYPWKKGVGQHRTPYYDKAWRVEEPNTFGTDEFIAFCEAVGAEPYICTNAGTGTPEESSDWVEYCNLPMGEWAAQRVRNGHAEPHGVKYWSIGNENWGNWEIGAKTSEEWARYAHETAKMMKRTDPSIELSVASIPDLGWNVRVLTEAGYLLNWISIHGYWSFPGQAGEFETNYETLIARAFDPEASIQKTEHILGALGYLDKIRIAFDEWNLRGWCHPGFMGFGPADQKLKDRNDINSHYTMADAVFSACFLNACLRHCNTVGMANFSPIVNTVGAIFTHPKGIVLRPTYHVFDMYTNYTEKDVVLSALSAPTFEVVSKDQVAKTVRYLDAVVTKDEQTNHLSIVLVNLHRTDHLTCKIRGLKGQADVEVLTLTGESEDAYNDVDCPNAVSIEHTTIKGHVWDNCQFECPPHSVTILRSNLDAVRQA